MATNLRGKVALDMRDSTPDCAPFLAPKAPEGSPNVLLIAWISSRGGRTPHSPELPRRRSADKAPYGRVGLRERQSEGDFEITPIV